MKKTLYDCLEELMMELALYPGKERQILDKAGCAKFWLGGWFIVFKNGECALFGSDYQPKPLDNIYVLYPDMTPANMVKMIVPDSVEKIAPDCFAYCVQLKQLVIGKNVRHIGKYAFEGCERLEKVLFKGKSIEEVEAMENYPWYIHDKKVFVAEK